tara:strand:- start:630 stop:779 length:150 start_codon:yes stop_codon:yes gene_type:complete
MQNKNMKKAFIEGILNNNSKKNKNDLIKTFIKNKQIEFRLKGKNVVQKK